MLKIEEKEISLIIHDLIRVAGIIQKIENGSLTEGQRLILHGCEIRLNEIRNHILESVKENNNGTVEKGN